MTLSTIASHRGSAVPNCGAALLFLLLVSSTSVAELGAVAPDFTATGAFVHGDLAWEALVEAVNASFAEGAQGWRLEANLASISWINETKIHVGRPGDPSRPYWDHTVDRASGSHYYSNVSMVARATSNDSIALVAATNETELGLQTTDESVAINPLRRLRWSGGANDHHAAMTFHIDLTAGLVEATIQSGAITLAGNVTLMLWETQVEVNSSDGVSSYSSGREMSSVVSKPIEFTQVQEVQYRVLKIEASEADLTLDADLGAITWASHQLEAAGNLTGTFANVNLPPGTSVNGLTIAESVGAWSGEGHLRIWNETGPRTLLGIRVVPFGDSVGGGARPDVDGYNANPVGAPPISWQLLAVAAPLSLLIMGGTVVLRAHPTIESVEWAILTGHPRRAKNRARRLISREPENGNALFLYGATLLALRRPEEVIRTIEPLVTKLPITTRTGAAMVLAIAAHRARDGRCLARWQEEASQDDESVVEVQKRMLEPTADSIAYA